LEHLHPVFPDGEGVSGRKGTPILIDMQAFLLPTAPKHVE